MSLGEYGIDTFGQLIADPIRTGAYAEALRHAVKPGSVVLDIGTGTGIFALLACRFGARHVHAVEPDPIIATAREIAVANGWADRIEFHQALSTEVSLPERADVIVSDVYGVLPLHRARIPALVDARTRLLAPGGVMIPRRDHLWLAVVASAELHRMVAEPWLTNAYDLDMKAARDIAANQWRRAVVAPGQLASAPVACGTLDYASIEDANWAVEVKAPVVRPGALHGFCVWFDADLGDGIGFSNAPGKPTVIYGNALFHWPEPVEARVGDRVDVALSARLVGDQYIWSWESVVVDGDGVRRAGFSQSTFRGMPLARGSLEKISAGHVARLTSDGEMDRRVLDEMAEGKRLGEIAERLAAEFPARFARYQDALAHVGELSVRYGR